MTAIVTCENVSIRYITGDFKDIGLKEYVIRHLTGRYSVTEFWADRHVTFALDHGDMLGIIGSNGAGKSTLLKAISGIMVPTEGKVICSAKVSALLELGSGFDGDLTVRENTYLRAAMLGYSREFVDGMYDSIVEFAELEGFQDRPFKQLSSGMKSRLAFSIASLVKPEILILDEVLSVGDGAFRKKSEAKMREIIGGGATTILVSHSVDQVRSMCNKILWLDHGNQIAFGSNVQGLCDAYQRYLDTGKLPVGDELPPLDLAPMIEGEQGAVLNVGEQQNAGAQWSGDAGRTAGVATGKEAVSSNVRTRKIPRVALIVLAALLVLAAAIAVSEARLPGKVRSLPHDPASVLYVDARSDAQVCLWDNRLYLYLDRASADSARFGVKATDNHGAVRTEVFDVADCSSGRYSTDDTMVLEVNLARYPGAVEVQYGLLNSNSEQTGDELSWMWSEVYYA